MRGVGAATAPDPISTPTLSKTSHKKLLFHAAVAPA
jgi:hypothetical protein